jgi:hypothetical protein
MFLYRITELLALHILKGIPFLQKCIMPKSIKDEITSTFFQKKTMFSINEDANEFLEYLRARKSYTVISWAFFPEN